MRKNLIIVIASIISLIFIIFIGSLIVQKFSKYGTYKLYFYEQTFQGETLNLNNEYEYYHIKLNRNKTFEINYKYKGEDTKKTAKGTYTNVDNVITLSYTEGQNPQEAMIFKNEVYKLENRELYRNQTSETIDTTIIQKLKK